VTGLIQNIAGGGRPADSIGDGGPATQAEIQPGTGRVAVDGAGNVYVADRYGYRVRKIQAGTGIITTIAGNGQAQSSGDGGPATAAGVEPDAVAVDQQGNLYIAESDNPEGRYVIRKMNLATGSIATIAGGGMGRGNGDNGLATSATLTAKFRFVLDGAGNIYIADGDRVRRVDAASHVITTVAGSSTADTYVEDQPATSVRLSPVALDIDSAGNLYILDYSFPFAIRRVDGAGIIRTVVVFSGDESTAALGDGDSANGAAVRYPRDVAVDSRGNLFIADTEHSRIRAVRGPVQ
jgi:DNA-binding beta-propeller fold protein YncE